MSNLPVSESQPRPTVREYLLRTLGLTLMVVTLALPSCAAFINQIRY